MPCWYYSMEIVSFDNNGNPTFHTEFYPADIFEPYNEIYLIWDDKGDDVIDEYTCPGQGVVVCQTESFGRPGEQIHNQGGSQRLSQGRGKDRIFL